MHESFNICGLEGFIFVKNLRNLLKSCVYLLNPSQKHSSTWASVVVASQAVCCPISFGSFATVKQWAGLAFPPCGQNVHA